MARRKGRPRKAAGEGMVVRIDRALATQARYLAAQAGIPLSDYLSALLRPSIEREMARAGKALMQGHAR